jgi:hypothetical protein
MKAAQALICWNSGTLGEPSVAVKIGPILRQGQRDWTVPYRCLGGAADASRHEANGWRAVALTFVDFHTMVVRDHVDPTAAHQQFLKIEEYRQRISPNIQGAQGNGGKHASSRPKRWNRAAATT